MKKALHYFQKQALQYSDEKYNSAAYLSPRRNHEPQQQQQQHHPHNRHNNASADETSNSKAFIFSTATTAIDDPHHRPQPHRERSSYTSSNRNNIPPTPPRISANIQRIQYAADHIRQSYELYLCPQPPPQQASPSSSTPGSSTVSPATSSSPSLSDHQSHPSTATPSSEEQYWVLYIPGTGHMHDPSVSAASFHPALTLLTADSASASDTDGNSNKDLRDFQHHLAGYVSVNYRIASSSTSPSPPPYSSHPSSQTAPASRLPAKTAYETDNATFADAVADVLAAIRHWQARFLSGGRQRRRRWIMVAHGFGALLALNALMRMRDEEGLGVVLPRTVVGVNGVYDLGMLHRERGEFEALTRQVLSGGGYDDGAGLGGGMKAVSPVGWGRGRWREAWGREKEEEEAGMPRRLILAHSRADKLVGWSQAQGMRAAFARDYTDNDNDDNDDNDDEKLTNGERRGHGTPGAEDRAGTRSVKQDIVCEVLEITGRHNECWETGSELARVVREVVNGDVLSAGG